MFLYYTSAKINMSKVKSIVLFKVYSYNNKRVNLYKITKIGSEENE